MQRRKTDTTPSPNEYNINEQTSSKRLRQKRTTILKCISILLITTGLILISKSIKEETKKANTLDLSLETRDETDLDTWKNAYHKSSAGLGKNANLRSTMKDTISNEEQAKDSTSTLNNQKYKSNLPNPIPQDVEIILTPVSGTHTNSNNAIFGFAQGYSYDIYVSFLESLKQTGYTDDVVLSVSTDISKQALDYLATLQNVIVYKDDWDCQGFNRCKITNLYYKNNKALEDTREYRPVATARYELYYAWSLQYSPTSWILLIDFRDTYFQLNPFETLDIKRPTLMLFEENRESVDLGRSTFNSRWLKTAYGSETESKLSSKPVLCSGSTIGSNSILQLYLRAMIQEYDDTKCNLKGCDQGFHNYLYYSSKLSKYGIDVIDVYEQGKGLINNLAAMRNKSLKEWGGVLDDKYNVLNWDGSLSAIVHQYDRDGDLSSVRRKVKREYMRKN